MTDLRSLMHDSAPAPARPLDMLAIRARARRRRTRRVAAWLSGLGLVAGLGVPLGGAVLQPGGVETSVDVHPAPPVVPSPVVVDDGGTTRDLPIEAAASVGGDARGARASGSAKVGPTTTTTSTAAPPPTSASAPSGSVPSAGGLVHYPAARECSVDNWNLAPNDARTCRFQAIEKGGASMHRESNASSTGVSGEVRITRDGATTTYSVGWNSAEVGDARVFVGCQFIVEAGDLVEVVLRNSSAATGTTTLGAGAEWGC